MSDPRVDAIANSERPTRNRRQFVGIPSAQTADIEELRRIIDILRENVEQLQAELANVLLNTVTITDLTKLSYQGTLSTDPIITAEQATDLARQKEIETAPLQQ